MLKKFAIWLALSGVTVFSWSQLLAPPVLRIGEGASTQSIIWALVDPQSEAFYSRTPIGGWSFLIVSFGLILLLAVAVRAIFRYVAVSRVPLSVLSTRLHITFDGPDLHRATITRHQLIHANRRNVQAYKGTVTTTQAGAYIDNGHSQYQSEVDGVGITERVIDVGNHTERDVIELFDKPLKPNLLITYLPNSAVLGMRRLFKKHIVERSTNLVQVGEFDGENAHFALGAIRYPVTNIVIDFVFPAETAPDKDDIDAFLIADNFARILTPLRHPEGKNVRYCIKLSSVAQSTVLIRWSNKRLLAWKAAQVASTASKAPVAPTRPPKAASKAKAVTSKKGVPAAGARRAGPKTPSAQKGPRNP